MTRDPAPSLSIDSVVWDPNGVGFDIPDRGVLLLLFFNLGCPGCTGRALPHTLDLLHRYPDLPILAVHTAFEPGSDHPSEHIRRVAAYFRLPYPVLKDKGDLSFRRFSASGTPHWFLLRQGYILHSIFGSMPGSLLRLDYALLEVCGPPAPSIVSTPE